MMDVEYDWVDLAEMPGFSGLFRALMAREPVAEERFPGLYWRGRDVEEAVRPKPGRGTPELWERLALENARLGAGEMGRRLLEEIRLGGGVFVATGQQPGLLGGPLYTLYKVATAVDLAEWIRAEFSVVCAPLLWNAGDDTDFAEVSSALLVSDRLDLVEIGLEASAHASGRWVGGIARGRLDRVHEEALAILEGGASRDWARAQVGAAWERAEDAGEFFSALYLTLFGARGLLSVDARWPEIRTASRDLFLRYTEAARTIHRDVSAAGEALTRLGYERRLGEVASRFGLLVLDGDRRVEIPPEDREREVRSRLGHHPETVSPNVLLRPIVQDFLFPVALVVLGPGEVSYWAQLREAYGRLGVGMPVVWPRLTATLLPGTVLGELGARAPGDALSNLDSLVEDRRWEALPPDVRGGLGELRSVLGDRLNGLRGPLNELDRGLVDVLESAGRKIDFQLRRLGEQAVAKLRRRSEKLTLLDRARNLVYPKGRPQERSISSIWPLFEGGPRFLENLVRWAGLHRRRLVEARGAHLAVCPETFDREDSHGRACGGCSPG